jgi:hypothetical protein
MEPACMAHSAQASLSRTSTSDSQRGGFYISDPANLDDDVTCLAITDGRSETGRFSGSSHASEASRRHSHGRRRDEGDSIISDVSGHRRSSRSRVRTLLSSVVSKATGSSRSSKKSEKESSRSRSRPSTSADGVGYPRPADARRTSYVDYYSGSESDWSLGSGKTLRPADSVSQVSTRPPSYTSHSSKRSSRSQLSQKRRRSSKYTTSSSRRSLAIRIGDLERSVHVIVYYFLNYSYFFFRLSTCLLTNTKLWLLRKYLRLI